MWSIDHPCDRGYLNELDTGLDLRKYIANRSNEICTHTV